MRSVSGLNKARLRRAWRKPLIARRPWWRRHGASLLVLGQRRPAARGDALGAGGVAAAEAARARGDKRSNNASNTRRAWLWACGGAAPAATSSPANDTRISGSSRS
ncbi:hypothetical protein EJB05_07139, partial [Eragrostis curvula]